ncbi:MAG TPA: glycosyltransferase family 4 protein [Gemmatales bacterium]|nr:glycosyltransferase family 4 protein [Gemmatales bacterium]HMP60434.1 glycosyltransferase family 4 protein [Gemmatales bacterium]
MTPPRFPMRREPLRKARLSIAITYEQVRPDKGGCETYIADLCRLLVADRHQVHIYAADCDRAALPQEITHHPLPAARGPRWLRPWRFARSCAHALADSPHDVVIGLVKTLYQDVLILQGGFHQASAVANVRKQPPGWRRSAAWLLQRLNPAFWSYRLLERRQLTAQPLIVVPSRWVADHGADYYGLKPPLIHVVPNAVPAERVLAMDRPARRSQFRERLGLESTAVAGLFVGHNYRLKGLEPLLRATARVASDRFRLLVCGDARVGRWRRLAHQLGCAERVRFLGYLPDVRDAYYAADFLVHPSFYDPCALVTLEALACGLPVITSRSNGAHELLPPPLAELTLLDAHDVGTLARNIEQLCEDGRRAALARVARQAADAWTMADHYRDLLNVLRAAIARKAAA